MSSAAAFDVSPASVLRSMRGLIVGARTAYPDVLHVEVRDRAGKIWRLASQDADFSPSVPELLVGLEIEDAQIDQTTGGLRCTLSDGSSLQLSPSTPQTRVDAPSLKDLRGDPPSWEVIAPDGLMLEFGPGLSWQIATVVDQPVTFG